MLDKPFAIFGFGRSGTTWLSDIISKSLGGLILFEPFHPNVWTKAQQYCYETSVTESFSTAINDQLSDCYQAKNRNPWLLRNHIGVNPMDYSESFINMVWDNSEFIGFKTIRLNAQMPNFSESHHCLFLVRHPLAVLSSIKRRKNFFLEFGWEFHTGEFFKRTLQNPLFKNKMTLDITSWSDTQTIAGMWALTAITGLHQCKQLGIPCIFYEDLYNNPYEQTEHILAQFDLTDIPIHPSYLFTPSMLTMRTAHNFDKGSVEFIQQGAKAFWADTFTDQQASALMTFIEEVIKPFENVYSDLNRYFHP